MRNQVLYFLTALIFSSCISDDRKTSIDLIKNPITGLESIDVGMPEIEMQEDFFDFGDVLQGEIVSHDFLLKNIGNDKLIINSDKGSCGCTVPDWPKEPILPSQEVAVKVSFNSNNREGKQKKTVTLKTNAIPNIKVITILANVIVSQKK
jgi:hypothetical protein